MRQRDVPFTREDVAGWLADYDGQLKPTKKLRAYLTDKLGDLAQEDIDTVEHDSLEDTTPLIEMILEDLPSYA
jgi:hypothetical protein